MASDWALHPESKRWVRSIYNHSGEVLYEWDYPGGALTLEIAGQGSRLVFHSSLSAGSARSRPNVYQRYDRMGFNHQSPPTGYQQLANHCLDDGTYPIAETTENKASSPPEWTQELQYEAARETTGRRTGRASISDRIENTTPSRSDASISQVDVEGLQGLRLSYHAASRPTGPAVTVVAMTPCWGMPDESMTGRCEKISHTSSSPFTKVKEQRGCCWCVPITTYSGQGVAKVGIDRSKHAIIHMRGNRPRAVQSEPRMVKEPLEVDPARPDQKLDSMSRVNFGKVYTVEHNVKVLPRGQDHRSISGKIPRIRLRRVCQIGMNR
ncbi:hypothetical protein N7453_008388, partial [Penicillium expansum]